MKESKVETHIRIWQKYFGSEVIDKGKMSALTTETLELPWIKKLLVFSSQVIVILEINSQKYVYVSPSIKNIMGYEQNELTDFSQFVSSMSQAEAEATITISEAFISCLSKNTFTPTEMLTLRSTRNMWLKKKDGQVINVLQHGFVPLINPDGVPILQLLIGTDITHFNNTQEHFYSLSVIRDNGNEEILLSGKMGETDKLITLRETEILKLISLGYSSQSIATQLQLSVETVKTHRKNLLQKTNTKNSIDLVRYGYAHGWL